MEKTVSTGRVAVKTCVMTFVSLVLALVVFLSFYMLIFTAPAADFFNDYFGWHGLGARLSYAAYQKSEDNDINLLAVAAERSVLKGEKAGMRQRDTEMIYQYTFELVSHEDFEDYAEWMDGMALDSPYGGSYYLFIKGYYLAAMYKSHKTVPYYDIGNKNMAVREAIATLSENYIYAYPLNNPVRRVSAVCAADEYAPMDAVNRLLSFFETAFSYIEEKLPETPANIESLRNICVDAKILAAAYRPSEVSKWTTRYNYLT